MLLKRKNNYFKAVCTLAFFCVSVFSRDAVHPPKNKIEIKDSIIKFKGSLNKHSVAKIINAMELNQGSWLEITSKGGEVINSLKLANYIYDNKVNLILSDYCLSSCANYIFPASLIKIIKMDTVLGFHGGPKQVSDINTTDFEEQHKGLKPEEIEAALLLLKQNFKKHLNELSKMEDEFYLKIGVSNQLPYYGNNMLSLEVKKELSSDYWGYYYSIEQLKKFNINNIYINSGLWSPKMLDGKNRFYLIE